MADTSLWVNEGGVLKSAPLSKFLRYTAQPIYRFRRFADAKAALGKNAGDTFNWDKCADVATIGGRIVETNVAHQTSQTVTKGTLTVNEYINSIPYTGKIEALSMFDIQEKVRKGLANDMGKVLDAAVEEQFNDALLRFVATSTTAHTLTTNGTATATNNSVLNERHVRKMRLELEKRNVPTLMDGTYVMIASLEAAESLTGALVSTNQYTETGYKKILDGEQGMVDNVRIIKDNNATRFTFDLDNRTKTAKSWTNGQALDAYMFGQDTVMEAVTVPEEVRQKEVTDFGRSRGLAWYFLGGWEIVWDDEPNQRIIKFDSAA